MKLLSQEQKDLSSALKEAGIDEHFHFVKKKGWLVIKHPFRQTDFSFHRKKATVLVNGAFIDRVSYKVAYDQESQECKDWVAVFGLFKLWLNQP